MRGKSDRGLNSVHMRPLEVLGREESYLRISSLQGSVERLSRPR